MIKEINVLEQYWQRMNDIRITFDQQMNYSYLDWEWEEMYSDFADCFVVEQYCVDMKLQWDTYASIIYGLSTHSITNPVWENALSRYKWERWLQYSFFDRWKRYRFLEYYDLSCYPYLELEIQAIEQLRDQLLKMIRAINHCKYELKALSFIGRNQ